MGTHGVKACVVSLSLEAVGGRVVARIFDLLDKRKAILLHEVEVEDENENENENEDEVEDANDDEDEVEDENDDDEEEKS
ncbi:hypothetical protein M0804_008405 [Polistes exclamans]|nr:hypothetical protein M0804_008405 [Polistes exclamans]